MSALHKENARIAAGALQTEELKLGPELFVLDLSHLEFFFILFSV